MIDGNEHHECVEDWLRTAPNGLTQGQLLRRFEQGFGAIFQRARQTLGEVTLAAILDRVVYLAAERFPLASAIQVELEGISCRALVEVTAELPREQAVEVIRFVLTEFLTVLGNLTADILTPALHAELRREREAPTAGQLSDVRSERDSKHDEGVT